MKTAILLAAGSGSRIWPFAAIRPKAMIPVANRPIVHHLVDLLLGLEFEDIRIIGGPLAAQMRNRFRGESRVAVTDGWDPRGGAFSLSQTWQELKADNCLVLYGDTLLEKEDVQRLLAAHAGGDAAVTALVHPLGKERSGEWICCHVAEGRITRVLGHPREGVTHRFAAFAMRRGFLPYLTANSGIFSEVEVGMMPPLEGTVEMSVSDYIRDGHVAPAVETQGFFLDVDKPWHILEANDWMTERLCSQLTGHELAEGAGIDDTAVLQGYVKLGRNSRIGRNVVVHGNLIVGDDTVIDNGAILKGSNVIGDRTVVANYCCIERNTTIGSDCNVNHCAELSGLIMDRVYLYHYIEFYGVIGEATDLGAATVCGTLRFDDGETIHTVKGRKEFPGRHANAVFLGDYSRTGVNVILMPGRKVGVYSVVGSGVVLNEDVPDRTLVYVKQELGKSTWGPERYGW